jgi:hypothetical protein
MNLIGAWVVDPTDARAFAELGDLLMEFGEGGGLAYTHRTQDREQIMLLRYWIEGSTIVTDQPSAPGIERTPFSLSDDGVLTLDFGGTPCRFKRQP